MSTLETIITRPDSTEEAVSFGVAILDEHVPGWAQGIDVETLYLKDGDRCVLGQLFTEYDKGCEILGLFEETPERCGFNVTGQKAWQPLQDEWRRVISERQAVSA